MPRSPKNTSLRKIRRGGKRVHQSLNSSADFDSSALKDDEDDDNNKSRVFDVSESESSDGEVDDLMDSFEVVRSRLLESSNNSQDAINSSIESDGGWSTGSGRSDDAEPHSPHSTGGSTDRINYDSPKPNPMEVDEGDFSESSFDGQTSLNLGEGPASLASPVKTPKCTAFQDAITEEPLSPNRQCPSLSPPRHDSPEFRRGRSRTRRSQPPPDLDPLESPSEEDESSTEESTSERDGSQSTLYQSSPSSSSRQPENIMILDDFEHQSQPDSTPMHSDSQTGKENSGKDNRSQTNNEENHDDQRDYDDDNDDTSMPADAVPMYEPDALDNLVDDLFTEDEQPPIPSRVRKELLRAKSVDDLFTSATMSTPRRSRKKKSTSFDGGEYPADADVSLGSPSKSMNDDFHDEEMGGLPISPPKLTKEVLENPWNDTMETQPLDLSPKSSRSGLTSASASYSDHHAENPWGEESADHHHDEMGNGSQEATGPASPHANPWVDFSQEQTGNDSEGSNSLDRSPSPHSPSQSGNPWAQGPTEHAIDQSPNSNNGSLSIGHAGLCSVPAPMALPMRGSPYKAKKQLKEHNSGQNEDNSSHVDAGGPQFLLPSKFALPPHEAPILFASQNDPYDCDDESRLTDQFEDEASMDVGSIAPSHAEGDLKNGGDGDPYEPPPQAERSDDEPSVSDLGESVKKRWWPYQSTMLLAAGLVCLLIFLAAIAGGILGAFVFGSRGETKEVIVYVDSTGPPGASNTAASQSPTTETPFNGQTVSPSTSIPLTSEPTVPPTTKALTTQPTSTPTSPPTSVQTDLPSNGSVVTNPELFTIIAAVSFDKGESILQADTPQQKAFMWLQNEDYLTNPEQRRKMQGRGRLRRLALSKDELIQRYAMAVFYFATNGDSWIRKDGWLDPSVHECEWFSDYEQGSGCVSDVFDKKIVRNLVFNLNGLTGRLPPEIGLLTGLRRLDIMGDPAGANLAGGAVPIQVGLLKQLNYLTIRGHSFNETLPDDLFESLGLLTVVNLSSNKLPGRIPSSVVNLTNAEKINLSENELVEGFPDFIAEMEGLKEIELQNNSLVGQLPTAIVNFTLIELFDVSNNDFTGPLPDFSGWSAARARLDFSDNGFTGPLHDNFASLGDLEIFRARNNLLSGELPSSLALLDSLVELDISGNNLAGNVTGAMCTVFNASEATVIVDCDNVSCDCCSAC